MELAGAWLLKLSLDNEEGVSVGLWIGIVDSGEKWKWNGKRKEKVTRPEGDCVMFSVNG